MNPEKWDYDFIYIEPVPWNSKKRKRFLSCGKEITNLWKQILKKLEDEGGVNLKEIRKFIIS